MNEAGQITLVATPIGNLEDFSIRAKKALQEADIILCEDTRVTGKLLSAYAIDTPLESFHDHNEAQRIDLVLDRVKEGKSIALVSDAGTPLMSDPGYRLIKAAIKEGIKITGIPGANAALMALTLSGLPPHPYMFIGFPPPRLAARQESFATLCAAERAGLFATLIWHEAPHRLLDMLEDMKKVFGADRKAVVARELTKKFEEVQRHSIEGLIQHFTQNPVRGEIIVLLAPPEPQQESQDDLDMRLLEALKTLSVKDAASVVANTVHLPKRVVYQRALELSKIG